ncbi:MAG: NRAMP family divalent metal transporter [Armatimonadota bacterium]
MRNRISRHKLIPLLAAIGPGLIAANADNDAGGITTYSLAGARFGYSLIWILILITISLAVTQEMGARMGAVTGKGFGGLIREKFGARWAAFAIFAMLIANLGTTTAEFAGIQASLAIFGVNKFISIPIAAIAVYYLIAKFDFKRVQKVFLVSSILYLTYVISGVVANPDWSLAAQNIVRPQIPPISSSLFKNYLIMLVAVIGTTITPWGQFFIQSYIVDKRLGAEDLPYARADVFVGSFFTNFIAFFIIVACAATLWKSGMPVLPTDDAATLSQALAPLAGRFASTIFAFGLLNASFLGAAILPLTSSYATCETFGWEAGINKTTKEAPIFYGLFIFFILVSSLIVLIPGLPLLAIMFWPQILNGALLPIILIFAIKITNDRLVMSKYTNSKPFNYIALTTAIVLIILTVVMIITQLMQYLNINI